MTAVTVRRAVVALALLAAAAPPAAVPAAASAGATLRALTVDDYFRLGDVGDPRLSPDGAWVAYTVTTGDLEGDRS
jgi:hypothetical protein